MLWVYLAAAFALLFACFHYQRLRAKGNDLWASLVYFAAVFCLFLIIPVLIILVLSPDPLSFLEQTGMSLGNWRRGIWIVALGTPLAILSGFVGSRDGQLSRFYPLSKLACRSLKSFIAFEGAYLFLYYPAWEFLYRGILFFPMIPAIGLVPSLALQTLISTLHHAGHPQSEIVAAFAGGFIFGLIAYFTDSIIYPIFIHALIGIFTDTFIYFRVYRSAGQR